MGERSAKVFCREGPSIFGRHFRNERNFRFAFKSRVLQDAAGAFAIKAKFIHDIRFGGQSCNTTGCGGTPAASAVVSGSGISSSRFLKIKIMSKQKNTHRLTVSWFKDDVKKLAAIEKFLAEQDLRVPHAVLMRCILHIAKIDPLLVQVTRIKWHEELKTP